MARQIIPQSRFSGLSYAEKEGIKSSVLWAKSIDFRTDPGKLKLLPRATKSSGTVVTDLILDGDRYLTDTYLYGDAGNIYKMATGDTWSNLRMVNDSHGNGMKYFGEDGYLYYASDTVLGRYGHMTATAPTFADDFLGAEGGVPTNTYSLECEETSSMYATAADSASLSITGDMTIEANLKWESLPAAGEEMVMVSKWNGSSDERSYRFGLYAISGYFGDGSDGALTISSDTTQAPVDSACTGTAAAYTLSATNTSFAVGQKILIHQSQGTGAGKWERNEIAGYTAGTITLITVLINSYTTGAQVLVLSEYTSVTVNSGKTWTAKAWNGTVGGILAFLASGTVTVTGTINASGKGFRGGAADTTGWAGGYTGEGTQGASTQNVPDSGGSGGGTSIATSGAGGGNGTAGVNGSIYNSITALGGDLVGTTDLTTANMGGGGGGGSSSNTPGAGSNGGGFIFISGVTLTVSGSVVASGVAGVNSATGRAGGGGAGGSILLKSQTATLGTSLIAAIGGTGGTGGEKNGGAGGVGRIHLDYYTSYTGTTNPTLNATQDNNLITTTSYQLRLGVSATNGTSANSEYLAKTLVTNPAVDTWYHYAVAWDASAATAYFYVNGAYEGLSTGTKTAIYDSTALFAVGANFNDAGAAENFIDAKIDDVRVWNDMRTLSELYTNKQIEMVGTEANLKGYWTLDNDDDDITANNNDLTLVNTPTYSIDVPFAAPTTRRDLDQSLDTSAQVYSLTTAIAETATHRQTFIPAKDPQKSIQINISDTGDDNDWTLTVHDALNRVVATKTIVHANLAVGDMEFTFSSVWRPIIGASYHFHLTATTTTGAPAIVTTTSEDLETADYHSYYQFLVESDYHPIEQILNMIAIGNERYVATYDAITYTPHKLTLPSGHTVRCLARWREYLAIGTMLGSNISDYDYGTVFFWDGISTTYNFYVDVPQGAINSMMSGDPLYFMAGYSGDLMKYRGGDPDKILRIPKVIDTVTLEFNRKALCMWQSLVRIGMCDNSTSTTIERGIYTYGTATKELPEVLSFDYPLSLGITTGAELEIGMMMPIGSALYVSWRNGTTYGMDKVALTNAIVASGTCEFLITDAGKIYQEKQAHVIRGYFKELQTTGDSIKLKYKIDRASSWTEGTAVTTSGLKEARLTLPTMSNRYNEIQVAVDIQTSNTISPEFFGWGLDYEDSTRERRT